MKIILIIALILLSSVSLYFIYLGYQSRTQQPPILGIINNSLSACPNTPNCISSEADANTDHFTPPYIVPSSQAKLILANTEAAIINLGGQVHTKSDQYIYATFKTRVFQFVDDFEVRYDQQQALLHFRSASRVGKSDFGANQTRVQAVKEQISL